MECFHMLKRNQETRTTTTMTTTTKSMSVGSTSTTSMSGGDHDMRRSGSVSQASEFSSSSAKSFAALSQRQSSNLREFSFSEMKSATKNFSRSLMIGEGGFGGVYRASIRSAEDHKKIEVAVKQLSKRGLQGHKEWVTEVNVLGVVVHQNLVKLLGYCAEDDERGIQRLLIYEYMPNRSVQDHLSSRSQIPLSWSTRMKIAQDAARGLAYLHEGMEFQIIFRDFKSSNILLDEKWNGKLSDFGLARLGPSDGLSHVSTAVVGTIGYAAPEYIQTGRLTSKSDVWSFGVFLYELITGRRPLDRNRPRNEQKLLDWVKPHLTDVKKFKMILDPRLEGKYSLKSAKKLASVANRCLIRQAKSRPKMSEILDMIDQIIDTAEDVVGSPQMPLPIEDEPQRFQFLNKLIDPFCGENGCLKTWKPTRSQEAVSNKSGH